MRRKKLRLIILIEAIIFILCISLAYGISKMAEDGKFKAGSLSASTDDENSRFLILVNKDNPLPDDYTVTLKTLNNGYSQVDEDIYDALSQMLSDGSEEGFPFVSPVPTEAVNGRKKYWPRTFPDTWRRAWTTTPSAGKPLNR